MEGNPRFAASQDIPDFAYAKFGEMLGFRGIFVDSPDRLAPARQEALSSDRPVVLEVKTSGSGSAAAARHVQGSPLLHVSDGQGRQRRGTRNRRHRKTSRRWAVRQKGLNSATFGVAPAAVIRRRHGPRVPSNGPACQQRTNAYLWFSARSTSPARPLLIPIYCPCVASKEGRLARAVQPLCRQIVGA